MKFVAKMRLNEKSACATSFWKTDRPTGIDGLEQRVTCGASHKRNGRFLFFAR